jgi:hypothetical protein
MEMQDRDKSAPRSLAVNLAICLGGLCILGVLMYCSITYPYPGGKKLGLMGFVVLWFWEVALVLFTAGVLAAALVVSAIRRAGKAGHSAKELDRGPMQAAAAPHLGDHHD